MTPIHGDCLRRKGLGQEQTARVTSAFSQCNSACVYAIVGAQTREIAPEAHLGVHASKTVVVGSLPKGVHVSAAIARALQGGKPAGDKALP